MAWRFPARLKVPFIPQMEAVECGAACLSMVLASHGRHASLVEMRQACGVSRDGANALSILRAAREEGLEAEAVKVEVEHLNDLPLPAILHWDFNHFLVLERVTTQGATLVDPSLGRRRATREELSRHFTGVALAFAPMDDFQKKPRRRPSLARYRGLLQEARPHLVKLLGASLMLQAVGLFFPMANQILLDKVIAPKQEPWLWGLAFGLGFATLGKIVLSLVRSWVIQGLQTRMDFDLMSGFMRHLLHLPLSFFLQRTPGDLQQRVQANVQLRAMFTSNSVSALLDSFLLLGYAALMLAYHSTLGLTVLAFGALRVGVLWAQMGRNQQYMATEMAASGREGSALVEAFSALETVKAAAAESHMARRWADRMVERLNAQLGRRNLDLQAALANVLFQGLAGAVVLWIGGLLVIREQMTVGVYASFIALQGLFLGPLESLLTAATQLQFMGNHLARLDDVLEAPTEHSGTEGAAGLTGAIEADGVSFAYVPGGVPILKQISLKVRAGEKIALVGPTGAGKSTLARLMLGLHVPDEGCIRFDGRDLRQFDLRGLRKQMGVVLQDTFLFDDTVRANLSLNDPDLPESRLVWAAKMACIWEVIETLPKGLDTRVGENGNLLSGGQRQRLSLARALAHDPAILLLDEATSSLDLETEARLHANLATLGCTRILIAHRLATVKDADRIFVVDGGRIVQTGRYSELEGQPGLFRDLIGAMEKVHG